MHMAYIHCEPPRYQFHEFPTTLPSGCLKYTTTAMNIFNEISDFADGIQTISRIKIGIFSLATTIILDLLITVAGEKIDIRKFPVNWMYLFAWLVIVPAVVLAGF